MGLAKMKEYDIRLTDAAGADLGEIFDCIAFHLQEPAVAENLVRKMHDACLSLSKAPHIYPLSRDPFLALQGFRVMPAHNYLIFYTIDEEKASIIIHRAIYGKRHYRVLFDGADDIEV